MCVLGLYFSVHFATLSSCAAQPVILLFTLHIFWGRFSSFPSALLCLHIRMKQKIICESLSCSSKNQHKFNSVEILPLLFLHITQQTISKCYTSNPNFFKNNTTTALSLTPINHQETQWNPEMTALIVHEVKESQLLLPTRSLFALMSIQNVWWLFSSSLWHWLPRLSSFPQGRIPEHTQWQHSSNTPVRKISLCDLDYVKHTVSLFLFFSPCSVNSD